MKIFLLAAVFLSMLCPSQGNTNILDLETKVESKKESFDLTYAKNIEVQCYIVTREQLVDLLTRKEKAVVQLPTKELQHPLEIYFLIRVKNTGNMVASGMLHCFVPNCGFPFPIKILKMPPRMEDYYDFIIQFDTGLIWPWDSKPIITYEWNRLDCYPPK